MSTDTQAESAARAAAVDGGAAWNDGGTQPQAGGDGQEDVAFDELLAKHGMDQATDDELDEGEFQEYSGDEIFWSEEDKETGLAPKAAPERQAEQDHGEPETDRAPAADGEKDSSVPAETNEGLIAARRALIRDGWSDSEIAGLPESTLMSIGAIRSTRQDVIDKKLDDRARRLDQGQGDTSTSAADEGTPEADDVQPVGAWDEVGEILSEGFADADIGAKALAAIRAAVGGDTAGRTPAQMGNGAIADALFEEQARAGLMDQYPQLKEDATWKLVNDEAKALFGYQQGLRGTLTAAESMELVKDSFKQASVIRLGSPASPRAKTDRQTARDHRGQGSITPPRGRVEAHEQFRTREDLDDAWMLARSRGDTARTDKLEQMSRTMKFAR